MPTLFVCALLLISQCLQLLGGIFLWVKVKRHHARCDESHQTTVQALNHLSTLVFALNEKLTTTPGERKVVTMTGSTVNGKDETTIRVGKVAFDKGEQMRNAIEAENNLVTSDGRREVRRVE